ncbi:MAG TPA: UvrB/UvrC motif-containing protein [Gemmatimonadales bacterium]|nr:UvrB/UvrC motif-containing protein [Gemmatimonadales bacterium]
MSTPTMCTQCGEREAVVQLTQIANDQVVHLHLCERCAAEKGVETASNLSKTPIGTFLASMSPSALTGAEDIAPVQISCSTCGATIADFKATGRLGCPDCWHSFERPLRELVRRLHGSSRHVGRRSAPTGPGTPAGAGFRREAPTAADVRDQLRLAVEAENFELAAELRDRLKGLE